jgi:hypothetical protein
MASVSVLDADVWLEMSVTKSAFVIGIKSVALCVYNKFFLPLYFRRNIYFYDAILFNPVYRTLSLEIDLKVISYSW